MMHILTRQILYIQLPELPNPTPQAFSINHLDSD